MKCEKILYPILSQPTDYLSQVFIQDMYVSTKIPITSYISTRNSIPTCKYLSWIQITNAPTDSLLSWLITPNPGMEVIQFLTSQIRYDVNWEILGDSSRNLDLKFLLPGTEVAYEPWDVCGNPIKFNGRRGKFTVYGQYGQFIIRSSDPNIQLQLDIYGYVPERKDPFLPTPPGSFYCLNGKSKVYTNVIDGVGMVHREVLPEYQFLAARARALYTSKEYFPCITPPPPISTLAVGGSSTITYQSSPTTNQNNFMLSSATLCNSICKPMIANILNSGLFVDLAGPHRFALPPGIRVRINISITMETYTYAELAGIPNSDKELFYKCETNCCDYSPILTLNNATTSELARFDENTSIPPNFPTQGQAANGYAIMVFSTDIEKIGSNIRYIYTSPQPYTDYYWDVQVPSGSTSIQYYIVIGYPIWENGTIQELGPKSVTGGIVITQL